MSELNKWHIQYKNHASPCFVAEVISEKLVYVNPKLLSTFQLDSSILGKIFHKAILNENANFDEIRPDWPLQDIFETEVFHRESNQHFHGTTILLDDGIHMFCELMPYEHDDPQNPFEAAMTRCVEIYQQPDDRLIHSFMELLCDFYSSDYAYVYRFNKADYTINCIARWGQEIELQVIEENDEKIDVSFLKDWIDNVDHKRVYMVSKDSPDYDPTSPVASIVELFHMKNLVFCVVEDANHDIVGVIGLSNLSDFSRFFDRRLLNAISHFVAQNVTKEALDATLFQLHHRDSLTGLYNRLGYSKRLEKILENSPKQMGVLSVNINGLKLINKNVGIAEGDAHIKSATKYLKDHFQLEFFRMSGDEFIGIAPEMSKDAFETKVMDLHETMRAEKNYDFSLGHAWGDGNFDFQKLLREAEIVMYINKQEYYSASQRHFESVNDSTLSDLLSYLANDEFMVYLQPQVRLKDGSLYGAEALIRRFDKTTQKMVFPDQFIPLYEQKSVIRHVDLFVVNTVCALLSNWEANGHSIPISVNLSRVTLLEYGIVESIVAICEKHKVPHKLLVIEVTERVGLIENNVASALITSFKNHGFNISLDDFGCAYSNIVTLSQIEVDEVKIDKSLVDDLTTSKKNHILVKNVLTMCNELDGASTLAEGIEDENQAKLLHELGCHLGQGYFYSRPIPVDEFCKKYKLNQKNETL